MQESHGDVKRESSKGIPNLESEGKTVRQQQQQKGVEKREGQLFKLCIGRKEQFTTNIDRRGKGVMVGASLTVEPGESALHV